MGRSDPPDFETPAIKAAATLNTNSYISIGLLGTIILCVLWLKDGQQINALAQNNLANKIESLSHRIDEQNTNIFTKVDFMRWLAQFQRDNNAAGNKVSVPEVR